MYIGNFNVSKILYNFLNFLFHWLTVHFSFYEKEALQMRSPFSVYFIRILGLVFASSSITSHRAYSHVFPSHSRKGVWHILCTLHYLVPVQVGEGGGGRGEGL